MRMSIQNLQQTNGTLLTVNQRGGYSHHNPIKFSTKSIEWSLCDYSDEYILDTGGIAVPAGSPAGTQLQIKAILHCSYTSTI